MFVSSSSPAEGFTVHSIDELTGLIKNRLKPLQYRSDLLDGFIAETGLMTPGSGITPGFHAPQSAWEARRVTVLAWMMSIFLAAISSRLCALVADRSFCRMRACSSGISPRKIS